MMWMKRGAILVMVCAALFFVVDAAATRKVTEI